MSNKIPCGGFYLDDMLNVNDSGELSIKGGTPYQQLVTDGNGNTRWEDRLAYDDSKLVVDSGHGFQLVKVSDEIPSWASIDAPIKYWLSNGTNGTSNPESYTNLGKGSFAAGEFLLFIATDNFEVGGVVYPEKGVYFGKFPEGYIAGIASADSDTPEITWDGNIGEVKKIDEKFLPDQTVFYLSDVDLVDAEGVKITLEQAKTVGLNFIIQTDYGVAKPISAFYGDTYVSFYVAEVSSGGNYNFTKYFAGGRPIN